VWGGGWGVLGLRCFSLFGLPGLGSSLSVGVMWLRGGSGDGAAPTVACQQWRANSGVQPRCPVQRRPEPVQPVVGTAVPATVTIDTLPATPATLCLPAGMAARRRCVMSELGSASLPPHRQPTDNVTSHIGGCTRITWHVCFTFFLTYEKNTTADIWTAVCHIVGGRDSTAADLQLLYSVLGRATQPPQIRDGSCAGEDVDVNNRGRFVDDDDGAVRPL